MSIARTVGRAALLAVPIIVLGASPAFADTTAPAAPTNPSQLTPQMVAGLIGVLVPILVSFLAKTTAAPMVKVVINLALTALTGALTALTVHDPATGQVSFGWVPFLTAWLFAFISSTITYVGALQHMDFNNVLLSLGGLFGKSNDAGSGVAGVVTTIAGAETQVQDDEATVADEYPAVERDPADLEEPVEGVDQ